MKSRLTPGVRFDFLHSDFDMRKSERLSVHSSENDGILATNGRYFVWLDAEYLTPETVRIVEGATS